MNFEQWWAKQTANFDPQEIGLMQLARVTWYAAQDVEREACANILGISRSDALLMAGEMTAQEWRTVAAVLMALQSRMRSNA